MQSGITIHGKIVVLIITETGARLKVETGARLKVETGLRPVSTNTRLFN